MQTGVHEMLYKPFIECYYWVTFIDNYSRYYFVLTIWAKSHFFNTFKQFKAFIENQIEHKWKTLMDNKRDKYMSNAMLDFAIQSGIEYQLTIKNHL